MSITNLLMVFLVGFAFLCFLGSWLSRYRKRRGKPPGLFFDFWKHAAGTLRLVPLLLLALVAAVTWGMASIGWDASIQKFFQTVNPLGRAVPWIVLIYGNIWHVVLALGFYLYAKWKSDFRQMGAWLAGIQAVLINTLQNTALKMLSGRRGPGNFLTDFVRPTGHFLKSKNPLDFAFDFWNHGHQDGRFFWPSGHTSSIFAFVSALRTCYPEKRWIPWVGYPFALFTALAMVDGDFHWASDVIAGGILGEVVGRIVGNGFRRRFRSF